MNGGMGVGMGTLMGGNANVYSGTPASNGDHLAQLINSLGMAGSGRASLMSLPEPLRSQVSQAVRSIENYVAHGLLTAAVEECMTVMELAPQYLDVHLLLGEIYVRQGKSEQAVAKYAVLVETYLAHGRIDDAIATFRRILQLEPSNLTYRVKLIELLTRQGRSDEALVERIAAADAYLRMGYADRAIGEYEQALMAQPNNGQLRLSYGQALMKAGRVAQAVGEIQRVLQVDPTNVRALATWQMALATGSVASPAISSPWHEFQPRLRDGGAGAVAGRVALRAFRQLYRYRARLSSGVRPQPDEPRPTLRAGAGASGDGTPSGGADVLPADCRRLRDGGAGAFWRGAGADDGGRSAERGRSGARA